VQVTALLAWLGPSVIFAMGRSQRWKILAQHYLCGAIVNSAERDALIALAYVIEPGDRAMTQHVWSNGAQNVLATLESSACPWPNADTLRRRLVNQPQLPPDTRIVTAFDEEWPRQLDDLGGHRPLALWVWGAADLRLQMLRSVSVVGARSATPYGMRVCQSWIPHLCEAGFTIVSGAAYGIDAAAHRSALAVDGMTSAVLACGVDVAYPRAHDELLMRISEQGLVISESPPGQTVRRQRFLTRNRLIAAFTRATVIVEAAHRSGTTSTANAASDLLRPVMAVPGPVTSPESAGCHDLIRQQQAILVSQVRDILEILDPTLVDEPIDDVRPWDHLTAEQKRVLDTLPARSSISLDEICVRAGLTMSQVAMSMGLLESMGFVRATSGGYALVGAPSGQFAKKPSPWGSVKPR
jgi:DNA processing protein